MYYVVFYAYAQLPGGGGSTEREYTLVTIEVMRLMSFLTCTRLSAILSGKTQVWAKVAVLSDA